jgi:hypothetical protein
MSTDDRTRHVEWVISSRKRVGDVSEPLPYDPTRHLPPQFEVLRRTVTPAGAGPWLPRDQWPTVASSLEGIRVQAAGVLARIRFGERTR